MATVWTRLFVGNLPSNYRDADLRELFSKYPSVTRTDVKNEYGYVFLTDSQDASDAVDGMPILTCDFILLIINYSSTWCGNRWSSN